MRRTFLGFVIKFTGVSSSSRPRERTVPSPFFLYSFSSFLSHARARCDQSVRTLSPPSLLRPSVASPPLPSLPPPPGRQVRKTGHPAFVPLFLSSNCAPLFFSNRKCRFFGRPGGTRQGWRCRLEEEEEEEEEEEGGLSFPSPAFEKEGLRRRFSCWPPSPPSLLQFSYLVLRPPRYTLYVRGRAAQRKNRSGKGGAAA